MLPKSSPKKAPAFKGLGPDERKRFGRLPAPSSTPNLLRHAETSPTVAEATPSKRPDPFDAHTVFQHVFVLFRPLRAYTITRILKRFQNPLRTQKIVLACGTLFVEPYLLHA